jgi:hypothetical protein
VIQRENVCAFIRRFDGWTPLRTAIASQLGCPVEDVIDLEEEGTPVAFLSAHTQHGEFAIMIELFIDTGRAPGYRGRDRFTTGLARALGEELLYDDGRSQNPYRWVLVQPDGVRLEVYEDTNVPGPDLVLDRDLAPVRLADA